MWRSWSALEVSLAIGIGGSALAVAVPTFLQNLSASKLSEPIGGLDRMVTSAIAYAEGRPDEIAFPPPAHLTPPEVPRGERLADPPEAWDHLTWRSLGFRFDHAHAFAFQWDSTYDPATRTMRFVATAHGDLDGDGIVSTFEVRGEHRPGEPARVLPGMFVDREVE